MQNKNMKILIVLFTLSSFATFGQNSKFIWFDELCKYESIYNTTLYSENQILNCYSLLILDEFRIHNTPFVFKPEDIMRLNLDTLDNEYKKESQKLKSLDLPKNKVWETVKNKKLGELEQIYTLSRIAYKAYLDSIPTILKQFKKSDTCLIKHSDALISGGDKLLKDWYFITSLQAARNAFPQKIWDTYNEQLHSKNKFLYAKIEVTTFGWWNCALNHIEYFDNTHAVEDFKKLFISTKILFCDEP